MNKKISVEVQSLIDAQDNPFVLIDHNYNIVAANKAYQQSYAVSEQEIIGHKCHRVSHHSALPCHMNGEDCPHKKVFESGKPHHVLHIHYDTHSQPEYVRIKGSPIFGQDGAMYLGEALFPLAHSEQLECEHQRMIGRSQSFLACIENLTRAAETDAPVLLYGESGVGKALAAEYLHRRSERSGRSFTMVDCSAISEAVLESELFGHERGAFTGCIGRRYGLFEQADGGTLFFNNIADLPRALQGRLLRAMETGQFRRVGGRELLSADVRIVCTSNSDLRQLVADNLFRADLYYRIAGIVFEIPTLRKRRSDIPELASALVQHLTPKDSPSFHLTDDAIEALLKYDYPGNIRELKNILQRAISLSTNGILTAQEIRIEDAAEQRINTSAIHPHGEERRPPSMKGLESRYIAELLTEHRGKRAKVARILGISERTLYRKLKQYGLQSVGKTA